MIQVRDLATSQFPADFLACLPTVCDSCGGPTEITETLTILRCANPRCIEKSVQRLVALLADLGVKGMGESKARNFLETFGLTNPYAIFMYEPSDGPIHEGCSMDVSYTLFDQISAHRGMLLWEYVKIGNLPGIRDSARKLFAEYDSLDEFYDDLEAGGIAFVQERLSIKGKAESDSFFSEDDVVSIKAVDVYNTLLFFKDDLFEALDFVDIKQLDTPVINICISTAVGAPFTSKQDFVSQMNSSFEHKVHLNFLGSVSQDCQFLIWSKEGAPTNKVTKVHSINDKRQSTGQEPIAIMTGAEFRDYLDTL